MAINLNERDRVRDKQGHVGSVVLILQAMPESCWVRWDYDKNFIELRGFEELELLYEDD